MTNSIKHFSLEVAKKVVYEIRMFRYAYTKLVQLEVELGNIMPGGILPRLGTGISSEEVCEASVLLESFLLHARVLREFFWKSRSTPKDRVRETDIVGGDFIASWDQIQLSGAYINREKDRLDKALAHLTTTRVEFDKKDKAWDVEAIRCEMESMICMFLKNLPAQCDSWFR